MKKKAKVDDLPDDLRCRRTDGRDWRCKQRVLEGKKLCHIHYLQGRRRSLKQKVPDSLKLERSFKKRVHDKEKGIRTDVGSSKTRKKIMSKKKRKRCVSEVLDEALRKMKLKRGDLQLELIRGFLNRQVEKEKRRREEEAENMLSSEAELTRELPNGIITISQKRLDNVGGEETVHVKIGAGSGGLDSGLSVFQQQRSFRSKNIEPMPISTIKVVPFADNMRRNKKCHWCLRSNDQNLIKCMKCRKMFFCIECIKQRYFEKQEIKVACPVCRGTCSCKICQRLHSRDICHKDFYRDKREVDKLQLLRYLVHMLLPVLKQINHNQRLELEIEAIVAGKPPSAIIQALQPEISYKTTKSCNNCKTSILDYHRSCSKCSYSLCLSCCWEYCRKSLCENLKFSEHMQDYLSSDELRMKIKRIRSSSLKMDKLPFRSPTSLLNWEACSDGSICCPPASFGGCSEGILDLRCMFPFSWMIELEVGAEELLKSCHFSENSDVSSCCSLCKETNRKTCEASPFQKTADKLLNTDDNFLYCPTVNDLVEDKVEHFQQHWAKGQPVVVRNVLGRTSSLNWDPVLIFCSFLENACSKSPHEKQAFGGTTSLDWCEVEIGSKQMLMGSLAEETHVNMRNRIMKIKAWLSSHLFQQQFPHHFDEIIRALPLGEYIHPISGLLNLAVKLPHESTKPDVGPFVHISVGGPEDFIQTDFLTKLCCESYDVVNILANATDSTITKEQYKKIKELTKKYKARGNLQSSSSSADLKGKSSSQREGCGESSLQNSKAEKPHSQNGNLKGPIRSCNFKGRNPCPQDGNVSIGSESDSETESEASYLFSKGLQRYEESDDECSLMNEMENITCFTDEQTIDSSAAQWDIFRREDVSKVLEYLRKHCNEFNTGYCCKGNEIHTIHDQNFFLDAFHKMRLKEEFDVQPWTLEQHLGEAIIIPAGCPYQIRKLKSCVNVVVGFISPENAAESIRLTDEIHLLPVHHKAREKALEVRKMAVHGINTALEEVQRLTCNE